MKQVNNNKFVDTFDILSIDLQERKLYDSTGAVALDWSSGGGDGIFEPATVRTLYLAPDAADVTAMGGSANNVYSTFQAVYDAGNALQVALGGSNEVIVVCGKCTAAQVGDLTLSANFNARVKFIGYGITNTELGNIIATNDSGNGYNIGTFFVATSATFLNLKLGNITTSATGATGNSGAISLFGLHTQVGAIDTSVTDPTNTAGTGGSVRIGFGQNGYIMGSTIVTSAQGESADAGLVVIGVKNCVFSSIVTCNNNTGGGVTLSNGVTVSVVTINYSTDAEAAPDLNFTDATVSILTITRASDPLTGSVNLTRCNITQIEMNNTGGAGQYELNITSSKIGKLILDDGIKVLARDTVFYGDSLGLGPTITLLGSNSVFENCAISNYGSTTYSTIDGIGTNCKFINCSILDGFRSIINLTDVNVTAIDCVLEKRTTSNVKIRGTLADAAVITWDVSLYEQATVTITDNRTLEIINPIEGKIYKLKVIQGGAGSFTLAMPDGTVVVGGGGGAVTLTSAAGSIDEIIFEYDGVNYYVHTRLNFTGNGSFVTEELYLEPFGNNGNPLDPIYNFPLNWTDPGAPYEATNDWIIYGDSDIIPFCNVAGSSQGPFMLFIDATAALQTTTSTPFSTVGFTTITVLWNGFRTTGAHTLKFYWSSDNSVYNEIVGFSDVAADDAWHAITPIVLPSDAANQPTIYLKWEITGTVENLYSGFDDIRVTGRP